MKTTQSTSPPARNASPRSKAVKAGAQNVPRFSVEDAIEAVLRRDPDYNESFVYGVKSTGIYCLPGCPSRRPKRSNIAIFHDASAARLAGFRSCERCKPDEYAQMSRSERAVWDALDFLDANSAEAVSLDELAGEVNLSPFYLQRAFKETLGISPSQYLEKKRMQIFKAQLRRGRDVLEASETAGFASLREPYEKSKRDPGMTPGQYRRGGKNTSITFTIGASALGLVLLARTARGICALYLGDDETTLESELHGEFPGAQIQRDDAALAEDRSRILAYVAGDAPAAHFTLDIVGTEFQREVWEALRNIPYGKTRSYQEVATMIGRPRAARAVAGACASNRISLLIPCHRVVRGDGSISGYRWNPERKRRLLELERPES